MINHRFIMDKQNHPFTILWKVLLTPIAGNMFLGLLAGIAFIFMVPAQQSPYVELVRLSVLISGMVAYMRVSRASAWRKEYETSVIMRHSVLEAYFKADEVSFEYGVEGGISIKCPWLAIGSWSEGESEFVFRVDSTCFNIKKGRALNAEEALELREFLKKNLQHKAV